MKASATTRRDTAPIPDRTLAEVLAKCSEILERLTAIEARLPRVPDSTNDVEVLERLLPAVGGKFGSDPWKVSEITGDPVLSAAALLGGRNSKRLGKLLRRHVG